MKDKLLRNDSATVFKSLPVSKKKLLIKNQNFLMFLRCFAVLYNCFQKFTRFKKKFIDLKFKFSIFLRCFAVNYMVKTLISILKNKSII